MKAIELYTNNTCPRASDFGYDHDKGAETKEQAVSYMEAMRKWSPNWIYFYEERAGRHFAVWSNVWE